MVGRRSAIIGITANGTAYDRTVKVDLLHVVALEDLSATSPPSANGAGS